MNIRLFPWIARILARLRSRPDPDWDYDDEAFVDDDTPPDDLVRHAERKGDDGRSDLRDDPE
ncbi:MAG TPA: hypothetical protein VIO59_03535 [Rhodanobacter sp.]